MYLDVREHPNMKGIWYVYEAHTGKYVWQDNTLHGCIKPTEKNSGGFTSQKAAKACADNYAKTHPDQTIFALRHKQSQEIIMLSRRTGRRFYETLLSAIKAIRSGNTYRSGKPTDYEVVEFKLLEICVHEVK